MIQGIIYKWTNLINNKVYIGKTTREKKRYREHLTDRKCNSSFHRALDKYGIDNFKYEVIFRTASNSVKRLNVVLNTLEIFYIKKYRASNKSFGYNLTSGGDGTLGCKKTQELRKVLSERMLVNNPMKGKKWTESLRETLTRCKIGHRAYNNREVIQLDLQGNYINTYESALKAAVSLGSYNNRSHITKACKSGKTAFGYKWKYNQSDQKDGE